MLINLHVKNLALIKEIDVDFTEGLVVLTGETGAGKSLILGSVNIALGNKAGKDIIRKDADYALVELTFKVDEGCIEKLKEYDIYMEEDNIVTVTRKITESRSVSKINGETVNVNTLKTVMSLLIDIHGQHDHQSLLYKSNHGAILDKFAGNNINDLLKSVREKYSEYSRLNKQLESYGMDETTRVREIEFAEFEINEIETANLKQGEDEVLEEEFKKLSNGQQIMSAMSNVYNIIGYDSRGGVGEMLNSAIREIGDISGLDAQIDEFQKQIFDMDEICRDLSREIMSYIDEQSYAPERVNEVETRLNLINHLKLKYGQSIDEILRYRDEKQEYADRLNNYQLEMDNIKNNIIKCKNELEILCAELSEKRQAAAGNLEKMVIKALNDLNFLTVEFAIKIERKENISQTGYDDVEFMISTNPGESIKPLSKVASGGELSRIMLAIKSILANEDEIGTMIFDEIDTGISGKTAQMVAEKLMAISRRHQVICISHLAQIAAMADNHYLIEKDAKDMSTETNIYKLGRDESIIELVRISSGSEITDTALKMATEMKDMADRTKLGQF